MSYGKNSQNKSFQKKRLIYYSSNY